MRVTSERLKARVEQLRKQGVKIRTGADSNADRHEPMSETSTQTGGTSEGHNAQELSGQRLHVAGLKY